MTPRQLLTEWLTRQLSAEVNAWLQQAVQQIESSGNDAALYLAVSLATRKTGKAGLMLDEDDLQNAQASCPGWHPGNWTLEQAARIRLLLSLEQDTQHLAHCLDQLCITADADELVAFYRGLPLYPDPPRYVARATEGLRSNMQNVFEAVAHYNPYPAAQLGESAWNQMVLKALFTGSSLRPITGLEQRCNVTLAGMLCDYARERQAAQRPIPRELWRCVTPCATGKMLQGLEHIYREDKAMGETGDSYEID